MDNICLFIFWGGGLLGECFRLGDENCLCFQNSNLLFFNR
jgi:hypothetical protein